MMGKSKPIAFKIYIKTVSLKYLKVSVIIGEESSKIAKKCKFRRKIAKTQISSKDCRKSQIWQQ